MGIVCYFSSMVVAIAAGVMVAMEAYGPAVAFALCTFSIIGYGICEVIKEAKK